MWGCNVKGFEYGLFRGRPLHPLAAACSYATCARMLHHARAVRRVKEPLRAWRFESEGGRCVFVLWAKEGKATVQIALPEGALVVDSFGRKLGAKKVASLKVSKLPLYISLPSRYGDEVEQALSSLLNPPRRG